jgi:hypothetical protein
MLVRPNLNQKVEFVQVATIPLRQNRQKIEEVGKKK